MASYVYLPFGLVGSSLATLYDKLMSRNFTLRKMKKLKISFKLSFKFFYDTMFDSNIYL